MKKYIVGAVLSLGMLAAPALTQAAALTTAQSTSLIAVVQSSPGTPASAFVNLITAFSNITTNQATSLIAVVQASPSTPANVFVDLLTSFTVDTASTQLATSETNQAVTQTATTQSTTFATPSTATTQTSTPVPTLATVNFSDLPTPRAGAALSVNPQIDYPVWQDTVVVSTNPVKLLSITFTNIGSVDSSNIGTIRLLVDGKQVGTAQALSNNRATFVPSGDEGLLSVQSHTLSLHVNIDRGASRTIQFQVRRSSDMKFVDIQQDKPIIPQYLGNNFSAATAGVITINSVTLPPSDVSVSPILPSSTSTKAITYSDTACIEQKQQLLPSADAAYIAWYTEWQSARAQLDPCYSSNSVPVCDKQMSNLNVEWQNKISGIMLSHQQQLTMCSPGQRRFGDISSVISSSY